MPVSRPMSSTVVATALVATLGLAVGCSGDGSGSEPEPSAVGTPLAAYDVQGVALERSPYCGRIAATGVVSALDGTAADAETWGNGDRAQLSASVDDVAHEYGCRYTREGASAESWLFAPPVTEQRAEALARQARSAEGCGPVDDAPAFGRPSVALVCEESDGTTASYRGLFGDSWLVCQVTRSGSTPREDLVGLAGRWCVEVVEAAS